MTQPNDPIKGVLLAGGRGTRLYPLTSVASKQLTAVYNKPMIYYPLTTMMMVGVRDILVISTPEDLPKYEHLLGDGSRFGISLSYAEQPQPDGIAQAMIIGKDFIGDSRSMLVLGDNLIYGRLDFLRDAAARQGDSAVIFAYQVADPSAYGVVEFDATGFAVSLEEKPLNPRSHWAVPGMYLYPPGASALAENLQPSTRGELEITGLNGMYMSGGNLKVVPMGRGIAWFDTGTPTALLEAANFIEAIERRQGLIIGSPEEVAFRSGYLSPEELSAVVGAMPESDYARYLASLI